jgi:hypothetical protein
MAPTHETMAISQPRVPAWKRVGLKLKYAKETAEPQAAIPTPSRQVETTKTSTTVADHTNDHQHLDQRPAKNRKVSKEPSVQNSEIDHSNEIKPNNHSDNTQYNGIRQEKQRVDPIGPSQNDLAVLSNG